MEAVVADGRAEAADPVIVDPVRLRSGRAVEGPLYAIFVLSGAAALTYELVWSRYLGLFVGHGAYAQVIVLAIFLGGMSGGALLVGRWSERLRNPLLWYAGAELAVGVLGFAFHDAFDVVTGAAYEALFPMLAGTAALVATKWIIAAGLILPQSVLLGTTFPFLSAGIVRRAPDRAGRSLSLLYFANSFGAAGGALIAGFGLIGWVGLPGAVLAAASANVGIAAVTYLIARSGFVAGHGATTGRALHERSGERDRLWALLLFVSFGTAVASFIYEISWLRMLSLVLGSATHSFELMLSAFILGLALGSLWTHRRADRFRHPVTVLGVVQWVMGCAALATLPVYLTSFGWMADLLATFQRTDEGFTAFNIARYAICLAVMLPSTFCAGITLPLITRSLIAGGHGERSIGWVYGINTLGSIVGAAAAGLILLPAIGVKPLLLAGAALDMAIGVLLVARAPGRSHARRPAYAAAAATVLALGLVGWAARMDRAVLSGGVFRYGRVPDPGSREVTFYRDGRTATVAVVRYDQAGTLMLSTNGKPDASLSPRWFSGAGSEVVRQPLGGDEATQALLPLISLAHVPDARTAAVIGQGSGMSSHLLLGSPILERLFTIEIEPEMIRGSRAFYPANRRVFDDPRSQFVIDDAKSFFAANRERYDLILSEPSNPWVSGVSSLFTTEFYARVREYLSDDGVFGQWLHLYEIDDALVLSVLSALHQNFPSYEVFQVSEADILIVASNLVELPEPDWSVFTYPEIAADLHHVLPFRPEDLESSRFLNRATLAPLLDAPVQPNSDFYPILDLNAEKTRFMGAAPAGVLGLLRDRFDVTAALAGHRIPFARDTIAPVPRVPRMQARAIGSWLRAVRDTMVREFPRSIPVKAAALHRLRQFQRLLASGQPPIDWQRWLLMAMSIERDLHGGTAGVVDERFYREIERYAQRHAAPSEVSAVIGFHRAFAAWDFPTLARLADRLIEADAVGDGFISPDLLRDGAVVANLKIGDVAGARRAYDALARAARRPPHDLRNLLLAAHLARAENGGVVHSGG